MQGYLCFKFRSASVFNPDFDFAVQKRVCYYLALAVYQLLCPVLNMHFPTESSGQIYEKEAKAQGGEVTCHLQMWPRDSQPCEDSFLHSAPSWSSQCTLYLPALGSGDLALDRTVITLHLQKLYYILSGTHYACKITIVFYLPSTLKFTKCIHTHYLILNKFTVLPDA